MPRHYSVREFFRQVPNALLRRYFEARDLFGGLDFEGMSETRPEALFKAWNDVSDDDRKPMDAQFREIFDLGNEKGFRAMLDEAKWQMRSDAAAFKAFVEKLAALPGHFERAMTVFLDHQQYWRGATYFHHADTLPYWRKRLGLPQKPAAIDHNSRAELASAIGAWFREAEGRGRNCIVELLRRDERDYFFAYPEDFGQQSLEWEANQFNRRPRNPAFEVVFVWSEQDGTLDLNHRGSSQAKEHLQEIFARTILKLDELPPEPKDQQGYDLNPLRRRDFQFVYAADSGIKSVAVRRLRLSSTIQEGDRVLVEADTSEDRLALYDLLDEVGQSLPLSQWNVTWAEISAKVLGAGDPRPKTQTFHVSWPNSCSLKYDDIGLMLRAMLKASGIEPK
jgi:hypothetical protein